MMRLNLLSGNRLDGETADLTIFKKIFAYRELLFNLIVNEFRERYLGSFFGFWVSIINPLLLLSVYSFIFSGILKIKFGFSEGMGNFALYLFCGLLPWIGFSDAVQRSSSVLLEQRTLIKRVLVPKQIFPLYVTISTFIYQFIALLVFLLVLFFVRSETGICILLLSLIFPLQISFTFGFCLLVSSLHIFFRDIGIFIGTLLQVWFFCTPIFYPESMIPASYLPFMKANPMFHLIHIYREIVLQNSVPHLWSVGSFAIVAIILLLLGIFVFDKIEDKIVDYL